MWVNPCPAGSIRNTLLPFIFLLTLVGTAKSWENSDLEMFDLVEEVGQNFYEVMGISQEATTQEIKQAYRRLSVKLHPDKNPEPDAPTKFRQLVGVYEVLKDAETRAAYHDVLENGLPNWRQPVYYIRKYKKLALWHVVVIVLLIVSVGQYLAGWASYWEKRIFVKERLEAEIRRTQRTRKAQKEGKKQDEVMAEIDTLLPRPSLWDIAPIQICRFCKYMVVQFPFDIIQLVRQYQEEKSAKEEELRLAAEEAERDRIEAEEPKKPRKRKIFAVPEKPEGEVEAVPNWKTEQASQPSSHGAAKPVVAGGLWTDDDIGELAKLCQKFPGGTPRRWENIASVLNRPVPEVTFMAKTVLERLANKSNEEERGEDGAPAQLKVKVKTKGGKGEIVDRLSVENWTAEEQKALENALQMYSKGVSERWDKISSAVPGRSKEECMQRFKYLADLVKKSREKKEEEVESALPPPSDMIQEAEVEEEEPPPPPPPPPKLKGNKISKKDKRRQRDLERHSSSSSTDPTESPDWCKLEDDGEE